MEAERNTRVGLGMFWHIMLLFQFLDFIGKCQIELRWRIHGFMNGPMQAGSELMELVQNSTC